MGALLDHVRAYYDALNTGDPDEVASFFTDDAVHYYTRLGPHQGSDSIGRHTQLAVERIGIDRIRAIVVEDSEGDAERLDREIETAVAAYRDPWLEGTTPAEPTQFIDSYAATDTGELATS